MAKGNPHRARAGAGGGRPSRRAVTKGERPTTRSRGSRLVDDPYQVEQQLNAQLRSMKLYASQTSGDGNCLFRALSDQFYGYPDQHAQLRQEICDYLAASPDRFAGFVDIEKPFDDYVHTMRQNGTYGGHLELSAFASLKRKEIKIVQPGLVYRVTGHDDSPEAIAERDTLERQREAIQGNLPSGSERPPASAREIRRRKRVESRGSRVASTEPTESAPEGSASAHTSLNTPVKDEAETFECPEAFGPLYIAYHNWEHYSSVRNLDGPHAGLPRIDERNVAIAAQKANPSPKGKGRATDSEEGDSDDEFYNPRPTEHEELILRSVPGHTLKEVRGLLRKHGNLWETVVEVLIAQDAKEAERNGPRADSTGAEIGRTTRSRATSQSYLNGRSSSAMGGAGSPPHPRALLPVPEHMRNAGPLGAIWRGDSPASSSGGDATSASTHATTTTNSSAEDGTSIATTVDARSSMSPETERGNKSAADSTIIATLGTKRAASMDPMSGEAGEEAKSPKRRSSSREREREERSVDGALASKLDVATSGFQQDSSRPSHEPGPPSPGAVENQERLPIGGSVGSSGSTLSTPLDTGSPATPASQSYTSTTYTYPLESSRGRLSPPLSPSLLSKEEIRGLSAREKREIELKRKRDRQRERRAQARATKENRSTRAKGKTGKLSDGSGEVGDANATSAAAMKRKDRMEKERQAQLLRVQQRRSHLSGGKDRGTASSASTSGGDVPKGFVELRI